jgi:hypothetical protein
MNKENVHLQSISSFASQMINNISLPHHLEFDISFTIILFYFILCCLINCLLNSIFELLSIAFLFNNITRTIKNLSSLFNLGFINDCL